MYAFGTKAETLSFLYKKQNSIGAAVLPLCYFSVDTWRKSWKGVWKEVQQHFSTKDEIIVRSSAKNEDSMTESMAGKYTSKICCMEKNAFVDAVNEVIASYGSVVGEDQFLVQPALQNVTAAGVAFTVDPNSGGNYYVINYDDVSGSTSSVTAGNSESVKLFYWFKGAEGLPKDLMLRNLCQVLLRLEDVCSLATLDVEFAVSQEQLYILQVRPLCLQQSVVVIEQQQEVLARIRRKIAHENQPKLFLYGQKTIYGVMPDWNPAEMIGIHPRNLALSLYKEIITDNVWAYQRDNYGYKNLRSFPLMVDFCGLPYIDVRVSFNSFIPADLDPDIAEKLVNYYLERLEEAPYKHDKVEFEIVFSCYTLDLPKRIQILLQYGFTKEEIEKIIVSLRNLTNRIINNETGLWRKDARKIKILSERYKKLIHSNLDEVDKMYWLIEDCKRYGTLPFAGLARAAFIAVQLLQSMVSEKIITKAEQDSFLNDLTTISSTMKRDFSSLSPQDFLRQYGHLRPGSYDITSPRYDERPEVYFNWGHHTGGDSNEKVELEPHFKLSLRQFGHIKEVLLQHGLSDDVLGIFTFIKAAIEGRERAKFIFTQNLSETLRLFGLKGESLGFSKEDSAFADIQLVKQLYQSTPDESQLWADSVHTGKVRYHEAAGLILPPLLVNAEQIEAFYIPDTQPTYITMKRIEGKIVVLNDSLENEIDGCILLIPSADPGFDWIFSHSIAGFVTEYGGANSHMAIRAAELSIPAIIGTGRKLFDKIKAAKFIEIDAALKKVSILQ